MSVLVLARSVLILALALSAAAGCGKRGDKSQATGTTSSPTGPAALRQPRLASAEGHDAIPREAQQYFDQGLVLIYSVQPRRGDPLVQGGGRARSDLRHGVLGDRLANGPHINNAAMDEAALPRRMGGLEAGAGARGGRQAPIERELIQALAARYADPAPEDRKPLDEAYAERDAHGVEGSPRGRRPGRALRRSR